jgi:hypothetical protein
MKARKVFAVRERGWRSDRCPGAEPQRLMPNSNIERKANTMKTYILRDPHTVEPKDPIRSDLAL